MSAERNVSMLKEYLETETYHVNDGRIIWIVCSALTRILSQCLFWEWTRKMEFVLSIVLLKMKSREKSRYCPFFDNNSAPSTSGSGRKSAAEVVSRLEILRGTWSVLLARRRPQTLWILVHNTGNLVPNYWTSIVSIRSRCRSEIMMLWALFLHLSELHCAILLKNLILMQSD